jgi:hypothetical protein
MRLTFTLPGPPVPWKRAGRGRNRTYTLKVMSDYQNRVRVACQAAVAAMRLHGQEWPALALYQLHVDVIPLDRRHGDASNYVKIVEDAIQGRPATRHGPGRPPVAFRDDKQVVRTSGEVLNPSKHCGIIVTIDVVEARAVKPRIPADFPRHGPPPKPREPRPKRPKLRVRLDDGPCRLSPG